MPRPLRPDIPGGRHHVMNRGARKAPIFHDDADYFGFLSLLSGLPHRFGVHVHGYALMPNHYHLLLEAPNANLSEAMRYLGGQYARAYNARYQVDGPIFRGRFKSLLVEDDAWWMHLLAYLHLNPVRGYLAPDEDRARFTSHAAYVGAERAPEWLCTGELLAMFGSVAQLRDYVHSVRVGRVALSGFDPDALWRVPASQPVRASVPVSPTLLSAEEALGQVLAVTGVHREALVRFHPGGSGNRAAWVAAWWLSRRTTMGQAVIGEMFGCQQSGVSQRIARLWRERDADPQLAGWVDRLLVLEAPPPGPWQSA